MKYDVIIVGAGPSSVFLAYELTKLNSKKKVLIIEQGKSIKKRFCPREKLGKCVNCKPFCNITCGFSGAGAFSDGKLNSYHLSKTGKSGELYLGGNDGGYLKDYFAKDLANILDYTDKVYLDFGADENLYGLKYANEIERYQKKAIKQELKLISYPIRHLGTEKAHILYGKLEEYLLNNKNITLLFDTTVENIIVENKKATGVKVTNVITQKSDIIYGKKIVLAVGRKGAGWLADMCTEHNIETKIGAVDIGVRYELPDKVMKDINKYFYEGKFIGKPLPYKDKVRTFCQNPSGFVATEVYDNGLTLVNGHSYKDRKSKNTNLAILVSHHFTYPFNKPIEFGENVAQNINRLADGTVMVQRLGDIKRGRRTWQKDITHNSVKPTLTSAVAGDITYCLGYRTMIDILNFIDNVDNVVEGFANPDNLLYAPEIKFYSNELVLNKNLETSIKNLYSIGDGGGLTTGLMMASASGVILARILEQKK